MCFWCCGMELLKAVLQQPTCACADAQVFYVESMSNPLIEVADLEGVASFSRRHGLMHVIDNTFATPVLCRPAELGFIVIHSATKFLNGHSDILAGVVSGPAAFIDKVGCRPVT